jgi:hypothetical protein
MREGRKRNEEGRTEGERERAGRRRRGRKEDVKGD